MVPHHQVIAKIMMMMMTMMTMTMIMIVMKMKHPRKKMKINEIFITMCFWYVSHELGTIIWIFDVVRSIILFKVGIKVMDQVLSKLLVLHCKGNICLANLFWDLHRYFKLQVCPSIQRTASVTLHVFYVRSFRCLILLLLQLGYPGKAGILSTN